MGAKVQISYYMASLGIKKPPTSYPSKRERIPRGRVILERERTLSTCTNLTYEEDEPHEA